MGPLGPPWAPMGAHGGSDAWSWSLGPSIPPCYDPERHGQAATHKVRRRIPVQLGGRLIQAFWALLGPRDPSKGSGTVGGSICTRFRGKRSHGDPFHGQINIFQDLGSGSPDPDFAVFGFGTARIPPMTLPGQHRATILCRMVPEMR